MMLDKRPYTSNNGETTDNPSIQPISVSHQQRNIKSDVGTNMTVMLTYMLTILQSLLVSNVAQ